MLSAEGRTTIVTAAIIAGAYVLAEVSGFHAELSYAAGFVPGRVGQPDLLDLIQLHLPVLPVWLTPLSAALLHGGWLHLGFNLLIMIFCGRQVEMVLGPRLWLVLFGAGAYAAALGQWALGPNIAVPMIGASGAISAIIGAYALLFSNSKVRALGPIPASAVRMLWLGAAWVFLQFLMGIASNGPGGVDGSGDGVAIGAHIGGFIAGMILIRPMLKRRFRNGSRPAGRG